MPDWDMNGDTTRQGYEAQIAALRTLLADERRKGWEEGRDAAWVAIEDMSTDEAEFRTLVRAQAEIRALTPPVFGATARQQDDEVVPMSDDTAAELRRIAAKFTPCPDQENARLREDVEKLREALVKAKAALLPLEVGVFNDNGDISVSTHVPSFDEQVAGYFAIKAIERALAATK